MEEEQWEYTAVDTVISGWVNRDNQIANFMQHLNDLGANGWELVTESIIHTAGAGGAQTPLLIFKRRVTE
ncbi:MAG: DUF4177 domain-containing protein [Leucobacter sp.]